LIEKIERDVLYELWNQLHLEIMSFTCNSIMTTRLVREKETKFLLLLYLCFCVSGKLSELFIMAYTIGIS